MPPEQYQGYHIDIQPVPPTGARRSVRFEVSRDGEDFFTLTATVTYSVGGSRSADSLAMDLGLRRVHGLLDLAAFEQGVDQEAVWFADMQPEALGITSEPQLRIELLRALRRMKRAEAHVGYVPWLDVEGFADVSGAETRVIRELLQEMAAEGLIEAAAADFQRPLADGACGITALGLAELRQQDEVRPSPSGQPRSQQAEPSGHPRVFVSYSRDSDSHDERVLALANRLRSEGVDCDLDRYSGSGATGWTDWMLNRLQWADFVLVVSTESYLAKSMSQDVPSGVRFESRIITRDLFERAGHNEKYLPVVFESEDVEFIPPALRDYTRYDLSVEDQYTALYAALTGQGGTERPPLGELVQLDARPDESGWTVALVVLWTGSGGNTQHHLEWTPTEGFTPRHGEELGGDLPVEAITVTHGRDRLLRFDFVAPIRPIDVCVTGPGGEKRTPDSTGGGLPGDEWHVVFDDPPF